jgi:peptidyl-prolyl cis-trans isomerase D
VFAVLLGITIISFILGINASGGFGRASPGGEHVSRPFYGLDLASAEDNQQLMEAAAISVHLQLGLPFDLALPPDRIQSFALQRHAALWLADQFHLPAPGPAELDAYLKGLRYFADPETGRFNPTSYATFRDSLKTNPRISEAEVGRILSDDARIRQVRVLLAGPGYILPGDVAAALELNESSWTVALASVDYASFSPKLEPTDADLQKYFADNPVEIPAQVRVDAIPFNAEAYLDKVSVTEDEARKFYEVDPKAFPKPGSAPPMLSKPADATASPDDFAAVRPAVEAALKLDKARRLAESAAADFAVTLFEQKVTPATLNPLLAASHLSLQPVAPFSRESKPAELGADPANLAKAFQLTASHPFSDELLTPPHGAVILVWRETIPARRPPFAEVRDRVASNWHAAEKKRLFSELGQTLHTRIEAALKAGTPFEQAAADAASAGSVKLTVIDQTGFTLSQKRETVSSDPLYHVLGALASLQKGQLGDMVVVPSSTDPTTPDQGQLVYVVDKKVPDLAPTGAQFTNARLQLAAQLANYAADTALGDLVQRELAKSTPAQP